MCAAALRAYFRTGAISSFPSLGHFACVFQNEDGRFDHASASTYRTEGDEYSEARNWPSRGARVGATATWEFRMEKDTLYMSGPAKVVDAVGQEMEDFKQVEEIRRRAR